MVSSAPHSSSTVNRIGKLSGGHGCLWVWFLCVVVNVHPGSVSLPACNSDYKTPHWSKLMQFAHVESGKHMLLTQLLFIQPANSDGVASDPTGKPDHSFSRVLPVRPVKGVDTGPFSMVMPSSFATPSVTWWVSAPMINTKWVIKPEYWTRRSLQYLTCLKTSRSLTDKLSFDVGLQDHSTGGL